MKLLGDWKNYVYIVLKLCLISFNLIICVNCFIKLFMIFGWNMDGKYLVFYNKFFFVLEKLFLILLYI